MAPLYDINASTIHSQQSEVVSTTPSPSDHRPEREGRRCRRPQLKGWELREQAKVAGFNDVQATQQLSPTKKKKKQGSPPPPQCRRLVNTDRCTSSSQIPSGFVFRCLENQKGAMKLTKDSCKLNQMKQNKSKKVASTATTTTKKNTTTTKQHQHRHESNETNKNNNLQLPQPFPVLEVDSSDDDDISECSTMTVSTIDSRLEEVCSTFVSMNDSDLMLSSVHDRWAGSSETSPYWTSTSPRDHENKEAEYDNDMRRKNTGRPIQIKEITIPSRNDNQPCRSGYCSCPFCGLSPQEQQKLLALMKKEQQEHPQKDDSIVSSPSSPRTIPTINDSDGGDVMTETKVPAWKLRLQQAQQAAPPMVPIRQRSDQIINAFGIDNHHRKYAATAGSSGTTSNDVGGGCDKQLFVPTRRASPLW